VLEVSSFQLEAVEEFRPHVAVILNLSPDHLDRHGSFEGYAAAKARLLERQQVDDVAVLNFDDPAVWRLRGAARARVLPFRGAGPLERGAWFDAGALLVRAGEAPAVRVPLDELRLAGAHNRENVAAALLAAAAAGADPLKAAGALAGFQGLRHRAEPVASVRGVAYVNDSKATNPGAALRALCGFAQPLVWIAGGADKGVDLGEVADAAAARARAAVLIGTTAGRLAEALAGRIPVQRADSIEQAVRCAAGLARAGDVVLLSPACASWDQFRDFEERGDRFRAEVEALAAEEAAR
jgi:UDP-N-acetylmuramoylalanine--D-glutamate ligase